MMRFKKFFTNHKSLLQIIFWIVVLVLIFIFWPRESTWAAEPVTAEIKIEHLAIPLAIRPGISTTPPEVIATPKLPRYGFTEDDIYLMTVVLSGSAAKSGDGEFDIDYGRSDEDDQIGLVLGVIMNRVRSDVYPDTVSEVIWQPGQFSVINQWSGGLPTVSDISLKKVTEWCKAYDEHDTTIQTIPEDHLYFSGNGWVNTSR